MRNKIILAMAAAGMMCATSAFAAVDHTQGPFGSGKVTFTGTITNSPCDIAPGDDDLTVKFGQISYRKLKEANTADTQDVKPVTIHLQNCAFDAGGEGKPALMSQVVVTFTGNTAPQSGDVAYPNTGGNGMAGGVGVQLLNSKMEKLSPATLATTGTTSQQLQNGDNQIQLFAQLINLGGADSVVPGNISIPLNYTLTYK
ncbi:fimbrial protein [Salmonella enterica subsp. enterica serovar Oranienburg]|nr:fimbrial protein [Salmonella enterica subsp. enterica serovar Oranienburg]